MKRYLLGQLGEDEQAELDERAFVDDAWAEKRDLAADELIEAYLGGELSADDRRLFEIHFLDSAAHRERFRFLRELRAKVYRPAPRAASSALHAAAWAAAAALVLASLTALFFYGRQQAILQQVAVAEPPVVPTTAEPMPTAAGDIQPVPTEPAPPAPRTLTIAVPEPARAVAIAVGPELRTVQFAIPLPAAAAPSYSVTVRHDGRTVWQRADIVPRGAGAPLEVGIPAEVLASGAAVLAIEPGPAPGAPPDPQAPARQWMLRIIRR